MAEQTQPVELNFEDAGLRIDGLLALVSWIERARNLTMDVEEGVAVSADFKAAAAELDLRWADAQWGADESSGLRELLVIVQERTRCSHETAEAQRRTLSKRQRAEVAHG